MQISITINGEKVVRDVEPRLLLVHFLREQLYLTGTHIGCETSFCGACTIHYNDKAIKSCTMLAVQADGGEILTIEGLSTGATLHPLQKSFHEAHGLQCGYCTPGMILSAIDLLRQNPDATNGDIRAGLEGNLCRCTGYHNIVRAIQQAAETLRCQPQGREGQL